MVYFAAIQGCVLASLALALATLIRAGGRQRVNVSPLVCRVDLKKTRKF